MKPTPYSNGFLLRCDKVISIVNYIILTLLSVYSGQVFFCVMHIVCIVGNLCIPTYVRVCVCISWCVCNTNVY
jgi:hypothetical protein